MPPTEVAIYTVRTHLAFALRLHRALGADSRQPVCWSPFSMATALGSLALGAAGKTAEELSALLVGTAHGALDGLVWFLHGSNSLRELEDTPEDEHPVFAVINRFWANNGIDIREDYQENLRLLPNAVAAGMPYAENPEQAREIINFVIGHITRGLVAQLLPSGSVDAGTIAMLISAVYLKTAWHKRFREYSTEDLTFHGVDCDQPVPTMRTSQRLEYAAAGGWQVVVLPAEGGVDALVLLPDGDLATAEAGLNAQTLDALLRAPEPTAVELFLPRFRLQVTSPLRDALCSLGVRTMFTGDADFSVASADPLRVSDVRHDTVLRVDEEGIEGAAATAAAFTLISMATRGSHAVTVRVDRPFLFLVRHQDSGALYFMARVVQP